MIYRCCIVPRVLCGPGALPHVPGDTILSIPAPPAAREALHPPWPIPSRPSAGGEVDNWIWRHFRACAWPWGDAEEPEGFPKLGAVAGGEGVATVRRQASEGVRRDLTTLAG